MSASLDAIGFPTRGLSHDAVAARLAEWVKLPVEKGRVAEREAGGRKLRVHTFDCGGGGRLVTVVELKKRYFLPGEEIVCFFPAFSGAAERTLELSGVETAECPFEPFGVTAFPDRLRFRIANPFEVVAAAGKRFGAALALLAGRVEGAPASTRPSILESRIVAQDPELPAGLFTVAGPIEAASEFTNSATGERCRRFRISTPTGPLDVVARARDAEGAPSEGVAVAEGEFVADLRDVA